MMQSTSYFEHVDKAFSYFPTLKSQTSVFKGARISKPPPSPPVPNINFEMFLLCSIKGEEDHTLVCHQLIKKVKGHKESYTRLYGTKQNYDAIYEYLISCISGPTLEDKWMFFPEIGHLITSVYEIVY